MTETTKVLRFSLVVAAIVFSLSACKNIPPPAPAAAPPPAAKAPMPANSKLFVVYFNFNKYDLTADGQKVVDAAVAAYKAGGSPQVKIDGYTDLAGTQSYNLELSKKRALTVQAAMVKGGVPANAIVSAWHGKENPAVPTADGVREARNRRAEIVE